MCAWFVPGGCVSAEPSSWAVRREHGSAEWKLSTASTVFCCKSPRPRWLDLHGTISGSALSEASLQLMSSRVQSRVLSQVHSVICTPMNANACSLNTWKWAVQSYVKGDPCALLWEASFASWNTGRTSYVFPISCRTLLPVFLHSSCHRHYSTMYWHYGLV